LQILIHEETYKSLLGTPKKPLEGKIVYKTEIKEEDLKKKFKSNKQLKVFKVISNEKGITVNIAMLKDIEDNNLVWDR